MKRPFSLSICLPVGLYFLLAAGGISAQEKPVNIVTEVIQDFDDPETQPWFVMGSRFSTEGFPRTAFVNAWPISIFGFNPANQDRLRALGIAMLFDRRGYNWVDVIPGRRTGSGADARFEPVELPIPGRVSMIDMWIWSGNFHYFLEVFLRDYKGIVHTIPMGDLNHVGWRNFRVNVPTGIPQVKRFLPKLEGLTLVKFRIWTRPTEAVAVPAGADAPDHEKAVIFYFDQLRVLTDTYEQMFDGDALTSPEFIQRVWGSGN